MTLRLDSLARRGAAASISVDGAAVTVCTGEMLAAALFAAGYRRLRDSPRSAAPRGMFCLMGACQECLVRVDGKPVLACQVPVCDGMTVTLTAAREPGDREPSG